MPGRPIKFALPRLSQRRPTRFRANVEALDTRRLMAAGVTGATIAIAGTAGSPLPVEEYSSVPPAGIGGSQFQPAPVGTPVPLVTLTSSAASTLPATGFSGTVNWGDGTVTDTALFGTFVPIPFEGLQPPANELTVNGPDHIYQTPGTYTITVAVNEPGDTAPTVFTDTATIGIPITGQLTTPTVGGTPLITTTTPSFAGTTEPGATVILSATSNATNQTEVVGGGVANAAGVWSITTIPFVDGIYAISARVVDAAGNTGSLAILTLVPFASNPLVVDAAVPTVTSFQVTNAKTGAFQVGFSDPSGLALTGITNPSNYTVTRPSPTVKRGQTLAVNSLTVTYGPTTSLVTGTLSTVQPLLTRNGTYTFTIHSAGITSLAGVALDGEYSGKFPTGNGQAGGDFQVKVNVRNGKASGPIAITPVKVTVHPVKARAVVKQHA